MPKQKVESFLNRQDIDCVKKWVIDHPKKRDSNFCREMTGVWKKFPANACPNKPVFRGIKLKAMDAEKLLRTPLSPISACSSWSSEQDVALDFMVNAYFQTGFMLAKKAAVARKECVMNVSALNHYDWSILNARFNQSVYRRFERFIAGEDEVALNDKGKVDWKDVIGIYTDTSNLKENDKAELDGFLDTLYTEKTNARWKEEKHWGHDATFYMVKNGKVDGIERRRVSNREPFSV